MIIDFIIKLRQYLMMKLTMIIKWVKHLMIEAKEGIALNSSRHTTMERRIPGTDLPHFPVNFLMVQMRKQDSKLWAKRWWMKFCKTCLKWNLEPVLFNQQTKMLIDKRANQSLKLDIITIQSYHLEKMMIFQERINKSMEIRLMRLQSSLVQKNQR